VVRRHLILRRALALSVFACCAVAAPARFDVTPPGRIVQDAVAYLSGEGMNSAWRVVTSRKVIGRETGGKPAYQWYVSFYARAQNGYKLAYRLPNRSGLLLDAVVKAPGADLYFPRQDVQIAGAGEFERVGVQDVVIADHQSGADCGTSDVSVFGSGTDMRVRMRVHVSNACALQASIVRAGALQAVRLTGPYYGPKAALCCPTKPLVSALLSYANGTWSVKPNYFVISASLAAHHRVPMSARAQSTHPR